MKFSLLFLFGLLFCSTFSCIHNDAIKLAELKDVEYNPKNLYNIKVSSFQLKSKVPGNKNVTCYYTRPYKKDGSLAPRANTVIYYAHYPMEKKYYKIPKKNSRRRIFIDLARRSGFTVFSVDFANSPVGGHSTNPKGYYYYPSSGSDESILKAYDIMLKKEKMPFTKFFMTGLSGGPSMSVNFTNTHPDKVDALALQAGSRYIVPVKKNTAAWLIVYTLNSHTTKKNEKLAADLRTKDKHPIVVRTMPNWGLRGKRLFTHCENWNSTNLRNIFLEDVADLRSTNNGVMPHESKWPYVISISNKNIILKNTGQKLKFKDPLYMTSLSFYKEYMKVIPDPLQIKLDKNNKMFVGIVAPTCEKPKGIIINFNNKSKYHDKFIGYDARFFAENSYMYLTTSKYSDIKVFKKILAEKFASLYKTTPILIVTDKLKIKDLDIKNLSKVILFCKDKESLAKIKDNIQKILKTKVKVTLLVHDKKLLSPIREQFKKSVNVIFIKAVSVRVRKIPSRVLVPCKKEEDFAKIANTIKGMLKEKIGITLIVYDKKLKDKAKKEFKKSVHVMYAKPGRRIDNIFVLCADEKGFKKIKPSIKKLLKGKEQFTLYTQDKKLIDEVKKEFKTSVRAHHYNPSKAFANELAVGNDNKAILKALNNIPLKSIEKQNKQTTLSP